MDPIIIVRDLKHVYSDGTTVQISNQKSLIAHRGEKLAILGANGTGKTTILSVIIGLTKPTQGQVEVAGLIPGKQFNRLRHKLGVVLQNVDEQIIGPRVYDDIAFTLRQAKVARDQIEREVNRVASLLGIEHILHKIPHYLSGGEKQKVALAGALVHKPELLILDEPLDSLDSKSHEEVEKILNWINDEYGVTVLLTTHDLNWVAGWADNVYVLSKGEILARGKPDEILIDLDKLHQAGLHPPMLVMLFHRLRQRGYQVDIPVTLDQAEYYLKGINNT
ncbi:energy-coupling factor ABC transporter ATP-binding protein [Natranaerobius thermophilus]|uniref:ABC transporter related n=1 Tax=Natranaerobius thermophilus (strain ATCC BAA-1301 / DSM 18059 / JW/NM-WN-LF) TaxID=457570 RepID=B2A6G5_NATTJ|nr:energy-coupling factor ABC transporter ATP-binding protein [Natranaerobius thermophilus]ACB85498.1 ABC transporter related [Natranaerobius thermophilus JW/NM-WN-LF]